MPDLKIRQCVWDGLKAAAAKQGKRPATLANCALEEYLRKVADEDLLARSQSAARRVPLAAADAEKVIRSYRARK